MSIVYSTRSLVVLFDCSTDKIHCSIIRKGNPNSDNWKVLQSFHTQRPGYSKLDHKTQLAALRQVLKAMRNRMTQALAVHLKY